MASDATVASMQNAIGKYNAQSTKNQLANYADIINTSQAQQRALADVEDKQSNRRTEAERFQAYRDLINAAQGLRGKMNTAMNGSTTQAFLNMLDDRMDSDNVNYWTQNAVNNQGIENDYQAAINQNIVNRMDAANNAEFQLRGLEADTAANLAKIGSGGQYAAPGSGNANFGSTNYYKNNKPEANYAQLSGYVMPDDSRMKARNIQGQNQIQGNNYFANLINGMNINNRRPR